MFYYVLVQVFLLTFVITCCCGCSSNPNCTCDGELINCEGLQLHDVPTQLRNAGYISLANNNIQTIVRSDFAGLTYLLVLTLSYNRISRIEQGSFSNTSLLELHLDNNRLTEWNPELCHFSGGWLGLHSNEQLVFDPCSIARMPYLYSLTIYNTSTDFNDKFVLASTACVQQYHMDFPQPPTFRLLISLGELEIGYHGTSSDLTSLGYFRKLMFISLFNFPATSFRNTDLVYLPNLFRVTLNGIQEFPVGFLKSSSMGRLVVINSKFSCLPKNATLNLPSLTHFSILNSSLKIVDPQALAGAYNLTSIDFSDNELTSLTEGVFDDVGNATFSGFPSIKLVGNPWHCDCKIKWFQDFHPISNSSFPLFCQTPSSVSGRSILSINFDCDQVDDIVQSETDQCVPSMNTVLATSIPSPTFSEIMLSSTQTTPSTKIMDPPTQTTPSLLIPVLAGSVAFFMGLLILLFIIFVCITWSRLKSVQSGMRSTPNAPTVSEQVSPHPYHQNINSGAENENVETDGQLGPGHDTPAQDGAYVEMSNIYHRPLAGANHPRQAYERAVPSIYMESL